MVSTANTVSAGTYKSQAGAVDCKGCPSGVGLSSREVANHSILNVYKSTASHSRLKLHVPEHRESLGHLTCVHGRLKRSCGQRCRLRLHLQRWLYRSYWRAVLGLLGRHIQSAVGRRSLQQLPLGYGFQRQTTILKVHNTGL